MKTGKISFTRSWNLVACVQGVPTHLNICLIRKVNLLLLLPAITPCISKPNIHAFCITHCFGFLTSHVCPSSSTDKAEVTKLSLLALSSTLSPSPEQNADGTAGGDTGYGRTQRKKGFH